MRFVWWCAVSESLSWIVPLHLVETLDCGSIPQPFGHSSGKVSTAEPAVRGQALAMGIVLDILALILLTAAISAFVFGVYVMTGRDDIGALFCFVCGAVLLRSSVDLLRPRSTG